jgi:hypothetical protein
VLGNVVPKHASAAVHRFWRRLLGTFRRSSMTSGARTIPIGLLIDHPLAEKAFKVA